MGNKSKTTFITILVISVFLVQVVYANGNSQLDYENLVEDWRVNNFNLQEINLILADAKRSFEQAEKNVKIASSSWSYLVDILNTLGKEITPMMKFSTVMQRTVGLEKAKKMFDQQELLSKTMFDNEYIRLREKYLAYWQSYTQFKTSEAKVQIAEIIKSKNDLLYKQGKFSELDLKKSEITYLEAKNKMLEAKRLLIEKQQSLNAYVGVELNTCYKTGIWEEQQVLMYNPVDKYLDKAIEECLDIKTIKDQIAINQLTIETYEKYFNYSSMKEWQQESYDSLKEKNVILNLQLTKKNIEIEKQLRELFLDINYEKYRIKTLLNIRNDASSNYLKIKELYEKGKASKIDLLQAEITSSETKDNYLRSIYNYNTQVFKFKSMSSAGLSENNPQGGGR